MYASNHCHLSWTTLDDELEVRIARSEKNGIEPVARLRRARDVQWHTRWWAWQEVEAKTTRQYQAGPAHDSETDRVPLVYCYQAFISKAQWMYAIMLTDGNECINASGSVRVRGDTWKSLSTNVVGGNCLWTAFILLLHASVASAAAWIIKACT